MSCIKFGSHIHQCQSLLLKGGGHGHFHIGTGDAETQNSIFKFSECSKVLSKVLKYAVKIEQNGAEMCIIMVYSVCGIAYKNVTSGTRNQVQEVFIMKKSL